jgi:integrase
MKIHSLDRGVDKGFIRKGVDLSVRTTTRETYRFRTDAFWSYLQISDKRYCKQSFADFLSAIYRQGCAGSTLNGYRCALLHWQRRKGEKTWARDEDLTIACNGYKFRHLQTTPGRGAITQDMLEELASLDKRYAVVFRMLFYGILRIAELEGIRSGDFIEDNEGGQLLIRKDKRFTARSKITQQEHFKPIIFEEGRFILRELQRQIPRGAPMFAWIERNRTLELVNKAASVFKWPLDLVFDGNHCLRHGGATFAAKFTNEKAMEAACMSQTTFRHYSQENRQRRRRSE